MAKFTIYYLPPKIPVDIFYSKQGNKVSCPCKSQIQAQTSHSHKTYVLNSGSLMEPGSRVVAAQRGAQQVGWAGTPGGLQEWGSFPGSDPTLRKNCQEWN